MTDDDGLRRAEPFRDESAHLVDFLDEVWVRCPRCDAPGVIRTPQPYWQSTPRFVCPSCTLSVEGRGSRWFGPDHGRVMEPAFGMTLLLRTPCAGHELWAYNERHLDFLAGYLGATLRERAPGHNASLASRLPAWMKAASHRRAVLHAIDSLRAELPPSGARG